jgi:di/tricarboxylate transporter
LIRKPVRFQLAIVSGPSPHYRLAPAFDPGAHASSGISPVTVDQYTILAVLLVAMTLFVWGRWRYDVVAVAALLAVVIAGIVGPEEAFSGFGHPAVITVAAVLGMSRALRGSGLIDVVARPLGRLAERPLAYVLALTALVAVASAFMNNVGALALLMPVAMVTAHKSGVPPSRVLMPLAFGSILGGLSTMIGTPPNIIVATYRGELAGEPFRMFDFSPVGVIIAVVGVAFVVLVGWRLIPTQRRGRTAPEQLFQIAEYITEARVGEDSEFAGRTVGDLESLSDGEVVVVARIRERERRLAPSRRSKLRPGDVLILEGDPTALKPVIDSAGLELAGTNDGDEAGGSPEDMGLMEAVVAPGSVLEGGTRRRLRLHVDEGVNLLAVARRGQAIRHRLGYVRFRAGDVLLLQGEVEGMAEAVAELGCLPLAERRLTLGRPRQIALPLGVFAAALALAAFGVAPAPIAFTGAVVVLLVLEKLTLRDLYDAIDWPVIVLLAAMIPIGRGLESTGTTGLVAGGIIELAGDLPLYMILGLVLVVTMTLSDVINNAATAVVMAPIAAGVAASLGVNSDPFLMAVALGASCAFLTPIGHQSNTLVMGPGGYAFGDYWRMGLPLEGLIVLLGVPLILVVWPP